MSAEGVNARYVQTASGRVIEPREVSEVERAPSGWAESAAAWIADMGEEGDYGRACVLDRPMLERIHGRSFATALDVGCGEGRFCRMLQAAGISTVGIDPTEELLHQARRPRPDE
jgi:2-polyprenyl-3-methyl-5-hydroxy-6-metoxy-1,4-benzoquinol methylase